MIVHDLDVFSPYVPPTEAKAELIVDTDAVWQSKAASASIAGESTAKHKAYPSL